MTAQTGNHSIRGKIIDKVSLEPLIGATVVVIGSDPLIGTITDIDGKFSLPELLPGRYDLRISFLGYEDETVLQVDVRSGKQVVLNIKLQEAVTSLEDVKVVAKINKEKPLNQMATVSARAFSVEETKRYAASISDPSRMALSYAGVTGASDMGNHIVIRGNTPRGILWRLEDIEIPNPNHFATGEGSSGGMVSIITSEMLDNSDFFTSAFPAEYGNATSGVFDLKLRKGNNEKREYSAQVGLIGLQVGLEGPVKKGKRASYLINYRYSTLKLFEQLDYVDFEKNVVPSFQDIAFNINFPLNYRSQLNVWGVAGMNLARIRAKRDSSQWESSSDRYEWGQRQSTSIIGLSHRYRFENKKTYLRTTGTFSFEENTSWEDTLNKRYKPIETFKESFTYPKIRLAPYINHKFDAQNMIRTGMQISNLYFKIKSVTLNDETDDVDTTLFDKGNTFTFQYYAQWKHRTKGDFEYNLGLHYTLLTMNKNYAIEPRVGVKYNINEFQTISMGLGLHSKIDPVSYYLAKDTLENGEVYYPNYDLNFGKAFHSVIGYDWHLAKNLRLKTEVYFQYLYDIPIVPDSISKSFSTINYEGGYTNQKFINEGTGLNYGIEFTLERFFSKGYYFLATVSLFESKYRGADEKLRDTRFNSKYVFNLLGGKEFYVGKNDQNTLFVNARWMWRGGYRYTPIKVYTDVNGEYGEAGAKYAVTLEDRAFEAKVPDYMRFDASIGFKRNKPKYTWTVSLDIQNLFNRKNVWKYYFDDDAQSMKRVDMLGIIPVINWKVEF